MTTPEPLQLWDTVAEDTLAVVRTLTDDDWDRPTALPGWSVGDVVAHLAHLESATAGMPQPDGDGPVLPEPERRNQPMPTDLTDAGVAARRGRPRAEVVTELEDACAGRRAALADLDVSDPGALAPGFAGRLGWDVETWLRNRPVDLWVHEMDLRRALGRPVVTDSAGAAHVAGILHLTFFYALRRQPPGTTVRAEISGPQGRTITARVDGDGRAQVADDETAADVTLTMDDVTWLVLGSGRATPEETAVAVTGDVAIGAQVLGRLNVMP